MKCFVWLGVFWFAWGMVTGGRVLAGPNVVIILADDCTFRDLPLYGGENALTPNIDRLAAKGLTFDRAYLTSAMCQPCRAELYTGQFPMRNGCAWNHSASRPETRSLPHYLKPLGYRVGLAGKVHVLPEQAYPFEVVGGFDPSCVREPTLPHDLTELKAFLMRDGKQPFCLVVGLTEPHVPWVMGDVSAYKPMKLKLPPTMADTPKTRQDFAAYLAEITYMDGQVGEIVAAVDEAGLGGETLILFSSEQGSQFPGNKWTCWDTGVHTALIARWPGRVAAGRRTQALVHYADVLPTIMELAGAGMEGADVDGESFVGVLEGGVESHRDYAFAMHNNVPEGPPYPVRSVTDGEWRYIRNLTPDELFIEKHLMGFGGGAKLTNAYWPSWIFSSGEKEAHYGLVRRYMLRPAEELYHTAEDPYEMRNLAGDAAYAEVKARLSAELERWMVAQGDPGVAQDSRESHQAAKEGRHRFVPLLR